MRREKKLTQFLRLRRWQRGMTFFSPICWFWICVNSMINFISIFVTLVFFSSVQIKSVLFYSKDKKRIELFGIVVFSIWLYILYVCVLLSHEFVCLCVCTHWKGRAIFFCYCYLYKYDFHVCVCVYAALVTYKSKWQK